MQNTCFFLAPSVILSFLNLLAHFPSPSCFSPYHSTCCSLGIARRKSPHWFSLQASLREWRWRQLQAKNLPDCSCCDCSLLQPWCCQDSQDVVEQMDCSMPHLPFQLVSVPILTYCYDRTPFIFFPNPFYASLPFASYLSGLLAFFPLWSPNSCPPSILPHALYS